MAEGQFKSVTIPILFNPKDGAAGLEKAMDEVCAQASRSVSAGTNIIILSDRGVNKENAPIPALQSLRPGRSLRAAQGQLTAGVSTSGLANQWGWHGHP